MLGLLSFDQVRLSGFLRSSKVPCGSRRFSAVADASVRLSEALQGSPMFTGLGALRFAKAHLGALRFAEVWYGPLGFAQVRYTSLRFAQVRSGSLKFADVRQGFKRFAQVLQGSGSPKFYGIRQGPLRFAEVLWCSVWISQILKRTKSF